MRIRLTQAALPALGLALLIWLSTPAVAASLGFSPNPVTDPLPVTAIISGSGYSSSGGNVAIYASPAGGPAMNINIATCGVDGGGNLVATTSTASPCIVVVGPSAAQGVYELTATQGASSTNFSGPAVITANGVVFPAPNMTLTPNPFTAGQTVTLTGCGWQVLGIANSLDIYLSSAQPGPGTVSLSTGVAVTAAASSGCTMGGSWTTSFIVPSSTPTGTYFVNAYRAGAGGVQSAYVQAAQNYSLSWTQPSSAAEPVATNPTFTG